MDRTAAVHQGPDGNVVAVMGELELWELDLASVDRFGNGSDYLL